MGAGKVKLEETVGDSGRGRAMSPLWKFA